MECWRGGERMLLVLKNIVNAIEAYPNSTSALLKIIGFLGVVLGYLFYNYNKLREKRYTASIRFYPQLLMAIKRLMQFLEDRRQLEVNDYKKGNIYSLLYTSESCKSFCPQYRRISITDYNDLKKQIEYIIKLLTESEENVHPKFSDKDEWIMNQRIIISFCHFVLEDGEQGITNKEFLSNSKVPQHIEKCKELSKAIEYIITAIDGK